MHSNVNIDGTVYYYNPADNGASDHIASDDQHDAEHRLHAAVNHYIANCDLDHGDGDYLAAVRKLHHAASVILYADHEADRLDDTAPTVDDATLWQLLVDTLDDGFRRKCVPLRQAIAARYGT